MQISISMLGHSNLTEHLDNLTNMTSYSNIKIAINVVNTSSA